MDFLTSLSEGGQFAIQIIIVLICLFYGAKKRRHSAWFTWWYRYFNACICFSYKAWKTSHRCYAYNFSGSGCECNFASKRWFGCYASNSKRILRRNPKFLTILAPFVTCFLTILCGTGHVVYTIMPIIYDIAIKNGIRPERPMAAASISSQMGIIASPVSVAVVSLTALLLNANHKLAGFDGYINLLQITIPSTLFGVLCVGIFSWFRGKDLDKDEVFQEKLKDPEFKKYVYGDSKTLLGVKLPKSNWVAMWIFLGAIALVALLGVFDFLRPNWGQVVKNGIPQVDALGNPKMDVLSMVSVIQMFMLLAGSLIIIFTKTDAKKIGSNEIFKSGMIALVAVFGISWMADTMFAVHTPMMKAALGDIVKEHPWTYAVMLLLISKFVNSQAAAISAFVPLALGIGVEPGVIVAFAAACYGYYILPTYPSDLATIQFDRSGTTHIGKFVINHSFILPGLIGVITSCIAGYFIAMAAGYL